MANHHIQNAKADHKEWTCPDCGREVKNLPKHLKACDIE